MTWTVSRWVATGRHQGHWVELGRVSTEEEALELARRHRPARAQRSDGGAMLWVGRGSAYRWRRL